MLKRAIAGYHRDEEGHWVADLSCGHTVHMRHQPPWMRRPWVLSESGRSKFIGHEIDCVDCTAEQNPGGTSSHHPKE